MKSFLAALGGLTLVVALVASIVALAGWYDVGADQPHAAPVRALLDVVRSRSIAAHAAATRSALPADAQALKRGGEHYAEMCAGCHLAPGADDRDLHDALYPQPPDLTKVHVDPPIAFWSIKHGIRMTGMPAWGRSHDDEIIWSIVAFVEKLPGMDPATYATLTGASGPASDNAAGEHRPAEHIHH